MLISCKECGKEISDQAAACPHCGAPVKAAAPSPPPPAPAKKGTGCGTLILAGVLSVVALAMCRGALDADLTSPSPSPSTASSADTSASAGPVIEIEEFICSELAGHGMVEGKVRNLSNETISYGQVAASFYTKDDKLIGNDTGYFEFTELLPGQTSPFKVMGPRNELYQKCRIEGITDRKRNNLPYRMK